MSDHTTRSQSGSSAAKPPVGDDCRYFLAEMTGPMSVRLVDGCHDGPEGVAKAAKLIGRIFGKSGPWVMVKIEDVPDIDVPINEADAALCREAAERYG